MRLAMKAHPLAASSHHLVTLVYLAHVILAPFSFHRAITFTDPLPLSPMAYIYVITLVFLLINLFNVGLLSSYLHDEFECKLISFLIIFI